MHFGSRMLLVSALAFSGMASAQEAPAPAADYASAPADGAGVAGAPPTAASATPIDGSAPQYGVAVAWRYTMVPGWFLGLFTAKNVPLYTAGAFSLEGFRRKVDKDDPSRTWELVVGVGYQNMSPPDGYWLGKSESAKDDTYLVQARNLSLITMDAALVSRQFFGPYFGIHYGAGLGLAIVRGQLMRISATQGSNGQYTVVSNGAQICNANAVCNQSQLNATQHTGPNNGPNDAHLFQDPNVPGALPIINILLGVDFRYPLPKRQAVELRLEGGFYDAFFIGLTAAYVI